MQSYFNLPDKLIKEDVEWLRVPGYLNTYACKEGRVKILYPNQEFKDPIFDYWEGKKGTYTYVKVLTDNLEWVQRSLHGLVCLAINGYPPDDGKKYEPNHINGIKSDNRAENLEWTTRSENVKHAYETQLNNSGIKITAKNIKTNQIKTYQSLKSMSTEWDIPRHNLRIILSRHTETPYKDEWLFTVINNSDDKPRQSKDREIWFKDYTTGKVNIVSDAAQAGFVTGINPGSVLFRTRKRGPTVDNTMLAGYVFRLLSDKRPWPDFTCDEATASREKYFQNASKPNSRVVGKKII